MNLPDYIFETSWEVCNKINGIHTVISGKSNLFEKQFGKRYILFGPDIQREESGNPEFRSDVSLYADWQKHARKAGFRFRTGYWNVPGSPVVILLDFSAFVAQKDEIFTGFWEKYKLDSLSGQWDYIEAVAFGYGTAKLIENFCNFNLNSGSKVLAHFHDWKTGAGLLYLNYYMPNIATVFTVHSPVIAQALAERGVLNYENLPAIREYDKALEFNILSRYSIEKIAAETADVFAVTSEFIKNLCSQFIKKSPDVITPNGYENLELINKIEHTNQKKSTREILKKVSSALLNKEISDQTKFIYTSGSSDFFLKGVDLLIETVHRLENDHSLKNDAVIMILMPAHNYGGRKDLIDKIKNNTNEILQNSILTHELHEADFDPILKLMHQKGITNKTDSKVKLIYAPVFFDGNDGIFNLNYFQFIAGFDSAVFPAYYEPWGFTVMESLALGMPTLTTSQSGFGSWLSSLQNITELGFIKVLNRSNNSYDASIEQIADVIIRCANNSVEQTKSISVLANHFSEKFTWANIYKDHIEAYELAMTKVQSYADNFIPDIPPEKYNQVRTFKSNKPVWRDLIVKPILSGKLKGLEEISKNLWWSWSYEATELFQLIEGNHSGERCIDPISVLKKISYEQLAALENDTDFLVKYENVYNLYQNYISTPYNTNLPTIAYFSMEYGMANIVKIYSGGLGILAGDYLKQASDSCYNMTAVGLFYRQGYFTQQITINGEQHAVYEPQKFTDLPAELLKDSDGNPLCVHIAFPGRIINIQIWEIKVGRISLFLLDSDRDDNKKEDRTITYQLYGGDNENRLKQEMLLGIGGIRLLEMLKIKKDIYHINEGHAALIGIERMHILMRNEKLSFAEAREIVRSSNLFTTHTPVPAGHDAFPEDLVMTYMGHYPERLNITWQEFIDLGKMKPGKAGEKFSMSVLAANTSQEINGVSRLHGEVTKYDIFDKMWEGYFPEELHIGYVTNGVHYQTWTAPEWQQLLKGQNGEPDFKKIYDVSDFDIWAIRQSRKNQLFSYLHQKLDEIRNRRDDNPKQILKIQKALNPKALTIGFARRFATYKRGNLIFRDIKRLEKIVNDAERPVQFIFAGKAHPNDGGGQEIIKEINEISNRPEFIGKVVFVENYNIALAKQLVQGVDIWLNTPTRPLEASGTSGMKAVMNGVLNFSVLDGWWCEGYIPGAGWALPEKRTYDNEELQNDLDAELIYHTLEEEIIPMFYSRNQAGVPETWVQYIKKCIGEIAPEFTTSRMIDDYQNRFYNKLAVRHEKIIYNDYAAAKEISAWKKKVIHDWEKVEVIKLNISEPILDPYKPGEKYYGEMVLFSDTIPPKNINAELIITEKTSTDNVSIISITPLKLMKIVDKTAHFSIEIIPPRPGNFEYAFRVYPWHVMLPHRMDFNYIKWI